MSSEGFLHFEFEHILNSSAHFASSVCVGLHLWLFWFSKTNRSQIFSTSGKTVTVFFLLKWKNHEKIPISQRSKLWEFAGFGKSVTIFWRGGFCYFFFLLLIRHKFVSRFFSDEKGAEKKLTKRERCGEPSRSAERDKGTRPWLRRLWKGGRNFSTFRALTN